MATLTTTQTSQYNPHIRAILADCYESVVDAGLVNESIQPSKNTTDFDLPNNYKVRIHLEKGIVYYSIFRSK